ncbi:hypothetical protein [Candidatus Planktophila dulcis]|uniref:hypothetical protein n=1 Tax=Candidatus Planktophila dulcis TaxID=1884914 RepID=UPI003CE901BC
MDTTQYRNHEVIKQNHDLFIEFEQGKILLLSPNLTDFIFWKKLLPNATFTISTIHDWNIKNTFENSKLCRFLKPQKNLKENKTFDLTIAQNVFMYIEEPVVSISNIADISDKLFIQDLKYRKRSKYSPYFGRDGDTTRYSTENSGNLIQSPYDLAEVFNKDVMTFQLEFIGAGNDFHTKENPPIHILAMMKLNSRSTYSEFRESYSKFSILRLRVINSLKAVKLRLLYTKSMLF